MFNMVLAALLAAGISGAGTYALMQRAAPPDMSAIERLNARLDELVALQQQQLVGTDRQIMLGRLMVRATTGSDPLPILQQSGK